MTIKTYAELILGKLSDLEKTQIRQQAILEEHVRRSDTLEKLYEKVAADVEPLKRQSAAFTGVLKAIGVLGAVVGLIAGVRALL